MSLKPSRYDKRSRHWLLAHHKIELMPGTSLPMLVPVQEMNDYGLLNPTASPQSKTHVTL